MYLIPIAAIVCIGLLLSTITRNSAAAVVGTLMVSLLFQLIGILPGLGGLQPYLLSTQFNAWQGLLRTPIDWAPIVRAAWVCALYGVPGAGRPRTWCSCAATSPVGEPTRSDARVLVVDDDPPLRRMLERTLAAEGFEVTVAGRRRRARWSAAERCAARRDRARRGDARARRAGRVPAAAQPRGCRRRS